MTLAGDPCFEGGEQRGADAAAPGRVRDPEVGDDGSLGEAYADERATGERDERRREQKLTWMRTMLQERLLAHFDADPSFASARGAAEAAVADGSITPSVAVDQLLDRLGS